MVSRLLASSSREFGWLIGRFGFGLFTADDGTTFNNRSLVVQLAAVDTAKLKEIALRLAEYRGQTVLVFNDNEEKLSQIGPDK